MREYLIKAYCTVGELQSQKEGTETGKLKSQLDEMKKSMNKMQEENKRLRKELEEMKKNIKVSNAVVMQERGKKEPCKYGKRK